MISPERDRVAEVIVAPKGQQQARRGSGYRVTAETVLTAAHVVDGAASVLVRFNADLPEEWAVPAQVVLADPGADVAVLRVVPRPGEAIAPVLFGRVGSQAAVVPCTVLGFPRFKLRAGAAGTAMRVAGPYRDCHQADGAIPSLSNWREGTLEVLVAPPDQDPDPARSPWEGMSGAAVWSGERIVGLISEHHRREGLNRLAAVRIEHWYQLLPADKLVQLRELAGLPEHARQLPDVIPSRLPDDVAADYTAQVETIAPHDLVDRDTELAELIAFCAGDETYQWWQADPWAGKTALAAWLVLHPPAGVTPVSFFITGRLAGQCDSAAFSEALIEQLAVVAGERLTPAATPAARDGQRQRLLKQAAARARDRGERLLIVVDGLDEDRGPPPAGPSSIASLLPAALPAGVRVLVTSRPYPGLPGDVPGSHPLRNCTVRHLTRSPYAQHLEIEAKRELANHLHGTDRLTGDIIGYLAAAGGGLTVRELMELTGASQPQVEFLLEGTFGRSLSSRPAPQAGERTEDLYLFAHETLQEIAGQRLVYDLPEYRQRIDQWADHYRDLGWPESTPRYLGRPYARLLATTGQTSRLTAIGADPVRHDQMLERTFGDADAESEIADAQQLHLTRQRPDLSALLLLANERSRLRSRNDCIPHDLPALWVRLGNPGRGQALAACIPDNETRALAQAAMVLAFTAAGRLDEAEHAVWRTAQAAAGIIDARQQVRTLKDIAGQLAAARPPDEAGPRDADQRLAAPLRHLARVLAVTGADDRAARAIGMIAYPDLRRQAEVLVPLTAALAELACELNGADLPSEAGQVAAEALQIAVKVIEPEARARALAGMADAFAAHLLIDQAVQAVGDAWQAYRSIEDQESQLRVCGDVSQAAAGLVRALIADRRWDEAEREAGAIALLDEGAAMLAILAAGLLNAGQRARRVIRKAWRTSAALGPWGKATALAGLARSLAAAGGTGWAQQAARAAERSAASITQPGLRAEGFAAVAAALADVGDLGRSEQAARNAEQAVSMADPDFGYRLQGLVRALADIGRFDSAERIITKITDSDERAGALAVLVGALADAGRLEPGERVAATISDSGTRAKALVLVVRALAGAGLADQAERVARDAERAVDGIRGSEQGDLFGAVALALVSAGRLDPAERAAAKMCDVFRNSWRGGLQVDVVRTLAGAGGFSAAERVAAKIADPGECTLALAALAGALIEAGRFDFAERAAAKIPEPGERWRALVGVASALSDAGEVARAAAMAARVERSARGNLDHGWLAPELAVLAGALSAAGLLEAAGQPAAKINQAADIAADRKRNETLQMVGRALADTGRFDFAERAAAKITDSGKRASVLAALVRSLARAGLLDRAERVIGEAVRATADAYDDPAWVIASLAQDLVDAGLPGLAEHVAREARIAAGITRGRRWESTFEKLTSTLAEAGCLDSAELAALKIHSPQTRGWALAGLARALGSAGVLDRAEQIAKAIERAAAGITDVQARAAILCDLVRTLAGAGLLDRAEQIANAIERAASDITDVQTRAAILCDLVRTLAGAGLLDRAEQIATDSTPIAGMLVEPWPRAGYFAQRARSLSELARAMADAGLADRAERVAADAEEATNEALAASQDGDIEVAAGPTSEKDIARQADVLIRAGQLDRAERVARAITPTEETSFIFHALFDSFAASGDFERAEYFGRRIRHHDPERLAQVLVNLTGRLASAGEFDWAEQVAQTITVPFWQAKALGGIVASLIAVGAIEQADRVAKKAERATEEIINPLHQSPALIEIITNCEQKAQKSWTQSAYQLCGLVLTRPYWPHVLPIICKLDFPALLAAMTAIQSQTEHDDRPDTRAYT